MDSFTEITYSMLEYNLMHLRQVIFEVTDACNLQCKYCAYSDLYEGYDTRENIKFPFHRAKLVVDYLYNLWSRSTPVGIDYSVTFTFYGGEPTLNMPFIKEIINYIESLPLVGRHFRYSTTTNAVLLDKYADYFVEKDFHLLISLDGDEEGQSYRVYRDGRNSFDTVYRNVKLLQEEYPEYFASNVSFNSVIHNRNGVAAAHYFIKNEFGKDTMLSSLSPMGLRKDKQEEADEIYCNIFKSIKETSECEALESDLFVSSPQTYGLMLNIHRYSGNVYDNYSLLLLDRNKTSKFPTGTCTPFSKKMFITVKGRILQCEKIDHQFSLGSVDDEKVTLDLELIAKRYNDYVSKFIKQCEKCAMNRSCGLCIYELDDLDKPGGTCPSFTTQKEFDTLSEQRMRYLDKHPELYHKILRELTVK